MGCPEFKTPNGIQIGGLDPVAFTKKVAEVEKPVEEKPVEEEAPKKATKKSTK